MVVKAPGSQPVSKRVRKGRRLAAHQRRQQLIEIAFDHIAERGFEGLRFQDVAAAAGINNASLLYHFSSKEALIQGVVSHLVEQMRGEAVQPAHEPGSAIQALRHEFAGVGKLLARSPKFFIVLTELALRAKRDPAIRKLTESRDDFWRTRLTAIIKRGIKEGSFRSGVQVDAVVTALIAQIKGIAHHATILKRKRGEIESLLQEVGWQVEHWLTCEKASRRTR